MTEPRTWAMVCGTIALVFGAAAVAAVDSDPEGALWMAGLAAINLAIAAWAWRVS